MGGLIVAFKFETRWKWAFFSLLSGVVAFIFLILMLLFRSQPSENEHSSISQKKSYFSQGGFTVTTTKENLNHMIGEYLEKQGNKSQSINYKVTLEENLILESELLLLNQKVPLSMVFKPQVVGNGDLLLKHQSFKVGNIPLPVDIVLDLVKESYVFPKWVTIQPQEYSIYLSITQLNPKGNLKVKAVHFDLPKDHIEFKVSFSP
jgi:uncharacterized protein YpmS